MKKNIITALILGVIALCFGFVPIPFFRVLPFWLQIIILSVLVIGTLFFLLKSLRKRKGVDYISQGVGDHDYYNNTIPAIDPTKTPLTSTKKTDEKKTTQSNSTNQSADEQKTTDEVKNQADTSTTGNSVDTKDEKGKLKTTVCSQEGVKDTMQKLHVAQREKDLLTRKNKKLKTFLSIAVVLLLLFVGWGWIFYTHPSTEKSVAEKENEEQQISNEDTNTSSQEARSTTSQEDQKNDQAVVDNTTEHSPAVQTDEKSSAGLDSAQVKKMIADAGSNALKAQNDSITSPSTKGKKGRGTIGGYHSPPHLSVLTKTESGGYVSPPRATILVKE